MMDVNKEKDLQNDFWLTLPNHVKHRINNAKVELDNNEGISHDPVMAEIDQLLKVNQ